MEISFKFGFIRDYLNMRRRVFDDVHRNIGVLEWLINNGNGLRDDNSRATIKATISRGKCLFLKTKSQRQSCDRLELLYNEAIELYEKNRTEFLSKA
ncbi:hypothetical protein ES708_08709 [subsurface metagenome]